jgi:hypothetical protein
MPQTLADIAHHHLATFHDPAATAAFVNEVVALIGPLSPAEMALDAMPASLQGNSAMPTPRKRARDDDLYTGAGQGTVPRGGMQPLEMDQDPDNGMSPETLADFVKICAAKMDGEAHDQFCNLLSEYVGQAHQNNQVNGDRRRRSARDQLERPSPRGKTFDNDIPRPVGGFLAANKGGANDHRRVAQDSAIRVRALNAASFAKRFPQVARVRVM